MTDTLKHTAPLPAGHHGLPDGIWPIRAAIAVAGAVDICRKSGQIGMVTGPSGIGKTTAARAVVDAIDEGGVTAHYVMMTRAADGLQPGLFRIARLIGANVQPNMGAADIYDAAVACIAGWSRGSVLVLDEAQFMSEALIDGLRNISDEMRGRRLSRGIVMVGTPDLAARINGRVGGRAKHHEPLRGRLYVADLEGLQRDDFATIAQALGWTGSEAADAIAEAGSARGGLHNVARVIETARRLPGEGQAMSLGHFRVAKQGLGVTA